MWLLSNNISLTRPFHSLWENNTQGAGVSYCCCKELPQTRWFNTTHIYCLIVLEVRSQKQFHSANIKVLAGLHSIWKREGKIHLLALPDSRGRLHSLAPGHTAPTSASAVASPSLTLSLLLPSGQDSSAYPKPSQIIQDDHLISGFLT